VAVSVSAGGLGLGLDVFSVPIVPPRIVPRRILSRKKKL
jgi:hypothetical protein